MKQMKEYLNSFFLIDYLLLSLDIVIYNASIQELISSIMLSRFLSGLSILYVDILFTLLKNI
jgi:hypothetical protein